MSGYCDSKHGGLCYCLARAEWARCRHWKYDFDMTGAVADYNARVWRGETDPLVGTANAFALTTAEVLTILPHVGGGLRRAPLVWLVSKVRALTGYPRLRPRARFEYELVNLRDEARA